MDELQSFYRNALVGSLCEPLCDEYKSLWRACGNDKEKLVRLAMRQQAIPYFATYCNKGKGVTKGFIKRTFAEYINGRTVKDCDGVDGYEYGLYVDYPDEDLDVTCDVSHIMWCVGTNVIVHETSCVTLYVSNSSNVHLVCDGFNNVTVYLFDRSKVTVEELSDDSRVTVYRYSGNAKVEKGQYCLSDNIRVFDKQLRL